MNVVIENYRGFEITFNTDEESFFGISDRYDHQTKGKQSYAAAKKGIDDYIKDNSELKPFKVYSNPKDAYRNQEELTIIGIRKDGLCKARKDNGSIITVSSYSLTNWVLWNPDNENAIMEIEDLSRQISALDDKRDALRKSLVVKTLKDVLNEMKAQG